MQKNETLLTPIYRHVLNVIQEPSAGSTGQIGQLERFKMHLTDGTPGFAEVTERYAILDSCIELIRKRSEAQDKARDYWNEELAALVAGKCANCYDCKSCKVYFWKELGEIFFNEPNDEKQGGKYLPIRLLPEEILRHFEPSVGMADLYLTRAKRSRKAQLNNRFIMLKGMSSSTPAMLNNIFDTENYVGGGFYFCWNGYGVAIDPGYYFIKNLHHFGLTVLDIDAVIITHNHIDHNNDMRVFDDLHFSVVGDDPKKAAVEHHIHWYMDNVSCNMAELMRDNKNGFNAAINELECLESGKELDLNKGELFLEPFTTQHIYDKEKKIYREHSMGCCFRCLGKGGERKIVYTSDTRYFPGLVESVRGADMVIANISGIYEDDYMLVKEKDRHLGYYGCYNLIADCYKKYHTYPKAYFLSEFWNGKSDIRFDVAKCLKRELGQQGIENIHIIPAEVGMVYDIEEYSIQCTQCGKYTDRVVVTKPAGLHGKVETLCDKCYFEW